MADSRAVSQQKLWQPLARAWAAVVRVLRAVRFDRLSDPRLLRKWEEFQRRGA